MVKAVKTTKVVKVCRKITSQIPCLWAREDGKKGHLEGSKDDKGGKSIVEAHEREHGQQSDGGEHGEGVEGMTQIERPNSNYVIFIQLLLPPPGARRSAST